MHRFDYSFLNNGLLPAALVSVTADIYSMRTMAWDRKEQFIEIYTELEEIAKVQSVKSSNEIEGIVTTDERINAIVRGNSAPLNHNEQEIAGYRDALAAVHTGYASMDLSESVIQRLHAIMLNFAGYEFAGQYKAFDNDIIEEDSSGRRRIRFHPTSAADTPAEMEQLVLAYRESRDDPNINQLLLIPCVILDFLCIHPFRDGNGRLSRLLSLLLLYKNGFDAGKYISFEEQINLRKGNYYEALKQSSTGWHENQSDYSAFIMEFLTTLYMCYKELDKRFAVVGSKKVTKQARVEATVLNSLTPISKADICKILADVSTTTVEAVLGQMVRSGQIMRIGSGRATKYVRK
ncbi:Fic family protein [Fusobacterium naviforme]|nr:Fic family protein [Fusobacterium naviforme]PSL11115.1 Fic family protein [Fusobacterium naviforme]STO28490.1 Protein involved in cell division [Fusobacterium naviforme]